MSELAAILPSDSELKMLQLITYDTSLETFRNAVQELEPDDFTDNDYKSIFVAMQESEKDGDTPELLSLMRRLPLARTNQGFREKLLDVFSDKSFFADCAMQYRTLLKNIRDTRINSMLLKNLQYVIADIKAQKFGVVEKLEQTVEQAQSLQSSGDEYEVSDDILDEALLSIGEDKDKVMTGLLDVDKLLNGGYSRGSLNIIGARPSMGKSTLAMNIATNVLLSKGKDNKEQNHVVYFTLEDPAVATLRRCELYIARTSEKEAMESDTKADAVIKANEILKKSKKRMWIVEKTSIKVGNICAICRRFKAKKGRIDLVVIDYLGLMDKELRTGIAEYQAIGRITRLLKGLAIELNVPVVLLSQLNRASENRSEPMLSDLRDSGSIEQDADTVMFLYREQDEESETDRNVRTPPKLKIAKNRDGDIGKVDLVWIPDKYTFRCVYRGV